MSDPDFSDIVWSSYEKTALVLLTDMDTREEEQNT